MRSKKIRQLGENFLTSEAFFVKKKRINFLNFEHEQRFALLHQKLKIIDKNKTRNNFIEEIKF